MVGRQVAHRWTLALVALALLAASASVTTRAAEGASGGLAGTVVDRDFGTPLAAARVSLVEARLAAVTGDDGRFWLERVPPGTYSVIVSRPGFEREIVTGVVVGAGRLAELRVELVSEVVDIEEVVVSGTDLFGNSELGLIALREVAINVQDSISEEQFRKSGASDVVAAVKQVTGVSIADGKYATVRGLSDRYTGTTVNGVRLPSADPRRRAVQVDLFPTGTIESLTVTKTFTPDLQGDSTGGGLDIKTRSIPEELVVSVSAATEHDSEATGNDAFLTYRGGGVDAFARAGSERDLPAPALAELPKPLNDIRFRPTPSPEDQTAAEAFDTLTRSFAPVMGVMRDAPGSNYSTSLIVGDSFAVGQGRLGVLGSLTYSRKFDYYQGGQNNSGEVAVAGQGINLAQQREDAKGTDELLIGTLGSVVLRPSDRHELSLVALVNQAAEDEARLQVQQDPGEQNQTLHYTERRVSSLQLHGKHGMSGGESSPAAATFDWFFARNATAQDEPDLRFFRNYWDPAGQTATRPPNSTDALNTRRIFREIDEENSQAAGNLAIPLAGVGDRGGQLRAGLFVDRTDREYDQRSFSYSFSTQAGGIFAPNSVLANFAAERDCAAGACGPDTLWTDVFLDPARIGIVPTSFAPNQLAWVIQPLGSDIDYTGQQDIDALYGMVTLPLPQRLELIAGARYERTGLSIVPVNARFGRIEVIHILESGDREIAQVDQAEGRADVADALWLPAVGLTCQLAQGMKARLGWSRTIARPTLRELAPVATEEFIFGDEYLGNPDVRLSRITNYDVRWEWFRRPGEVLAASAFHKRLTDPIELISFGVANRAFIQPINYDRGEVTGYELEGRFPLETLSKPLAGLVLGANYARIQSRVDVPRQEQASLANFGLGEPTRALQGQPAYTFNASVSYDRDEIGLSAGLFYNRVGTTLATGAARGLDGGTPNVFELPTESLDLRVSKRIVKARDFSLAFQAKNLQRNVRRSVFRTPEGEEAIKSERDTSLRYALSGAFKW